MLNLPLTPLITTYSGAFLGVYETIFYVFFASSLGSYLSLLINRYFLRNQNLLNKIIKFKVPKPSFIIIFILKAIPVLPFSWVIIYTSASDFSLDVEADLTLTALSDIVYQTTSTNSTAGHHLFKSFNTEIMRIDGGTNRVGIGTGASPSFPLHIKSDASETTMAIKHCMNSL